MSDLLKTPTLLHSKDCTHPHTPVLQTLPTRVAQIGENLTIRRALPHRERKTIGAWCFLDHFGPLDLRQSDGLRIGPHPHIGLQTFTWPMQGEIRHRDSLGSNQVIQPGQVNLMTAGNGISHSEESLPDTTLHGLQLWIALPDAERHRAPDFIHYPTVPTVQLPGLSIMLLVGEFLNTQSPVKVYSPLMGLDISVTTDTDTRLPLNPCFEYGILPLIGSVDVEKQTIGMDTLLYLGCGRSHVDLRVKQGARILMIGGEPFNEDILIWWNFVARTREEMKEAKHAWDQHTRFGEVHGFQGERLLSPELP